MDDKHFRSSTALQCAVCVQSEPSAHPQLADRPFQRPNSPMSSLDSSNQPLDSASADDAAQLKELNSIIQRIEQELSKVIVGQKEVIEQLLTTLFAGGHCLLIGVPGLAKTLLVSSLARSLDLVFNRIQFTPDLMPTDITGTEVIQEDRSTGQRNFRFIPGPVFANVVLADEINRTPPKTQAALLEAMQEKQVTVAGQRHRLPQPFFVLATQNPIEQEGTYPLPEAQLDRFMFNILVDYPSDEEELEIVLQTTGDRQAFVQPQLDAETLQRMVHLVRRIPIRRSIAQFAIELARRSRPSAADSPEVTRRYVAWGAGPRASQYLVLGAKARAALQGRTHADLDDVRAVAFPVLRHRIRTNFQAEADGISVDKIIGEILQSVERASEALLNREYAGQVFRSADAR
jgi:MoxR-like ATPase